MAGCGQPKNEIPSYSLDGLSKRWEKCDTVRRNVLFHGTLMQWKSVEATGTASYAASALNFEAVREFFTVWTQVCDKKRTPSLAQDPKVRELRRILLAAWAPERIHEQDDDATAGEASADEDDMDYAELESSLGGEGDDDDDEDEEDASFDCDTSDGDALFQPEVLLADAANDAAAETFEAIEQHHKEDPAEPAAEIPSASEHDNKVDPSEPTAKIPSASRNDNKEDPAEPAAKIPSASKDNRKEDPAEPTAKIPSASKHNNEEDPAEPAAKTLKACRPDKTKDPAEPAAKILKACRRDETKDPAEPAAKILKASKHNNQEDPAEPATDSTTRSEGSKPSSNPVLPQSETDRRRAISLMKDRLKELRQRIEHRQQAKNAVPGPVVDPSTLDTCPSDLGAISEQWSQHVKPEPIEIEDSPLRSGQVVQPKKPKQVVTPPPQEVSTAGIPLLTASGDVAGGDGATPAPAGNSMLRRANAYDEEAMKDLSKERQDKVAQQRKDEEQAEAAAAAASNHSGEGKGGRGGRGRGGRGGKGG
ncbi:unnamed protein product, partial [Symbiodinium sp. CCMP2592]